MSTNQQDPEASQLTSSPSGDPIDESALQSRSLETRYRETLLAVALQGTPVDPVGGQSVGSDKDTTEVRNYSFEVESLRDRLVPLVQNHVRITLAVGRFLWMMAGNDRLDDVRFYESKGLAGNKTAGVGKFSTDGLAISGSNYGQRLFRPRPGIDQVAACAELIRQNPNTRRAAMTVYQPEDAGRQSPDIPCTFGVLFSPRNGTLHQTVVMRSNNAWLLLPYNVFEFSLLGEIVASETSLEVGTYHHFAVSMHLLDEDLDKAREAISSESYELSPFEQMPSGSLSRVREICVWESAMRFFSRGYSKRDVEEEIRRTEGYGDYWAQFARVALYKGLKNAGKHEHAEKVAKRTEGPLGELLRIEIEEENEPSSQGQMSLFQRVPSPLPPISKQQFANLRIEAADREDRRADQEHVDFKFNVMTIRNLLDEQRARANDQT